MDTIVTNRPMKVWGAFVLDALRCPACGKIVAGTGPSRGEFFVPPAWPHYGVELR